jgi:hypothetical protein
VFLRGNAVLEKRELTVKAGDMVEIEPPAPPEPVVAPPVRTVKETTHPFTPAILYAVGAVAVVSVVIPIITYTHASNVKRDHDTLLDGNGNTDASQIKQARTLEDDYLTARTTAYATLAIPVSLAAITGGLVAWYFVGSKEHEVVVRPAAGPQGAGLSTTVRF